MAVSCQHDWPRVPLPEYEYELSGQSASKLFIAFTAICICNSAINDIPESLLFQTLKLTGKTMDFQLYVVRNGLSTGSKELLRQSPRAPCSRETPQGFSLAPCKLLTGAYTCISMDFWGSALTLNFKVQDLPYKWLLHKQTEITGVFAATQVTSACSCEVLCKYYWHVHLAMQM